MPKKDKGFPKKVCDSAAHFINSLNLYIVNIVLISICFLTAAYKYAADRMYKMAAAAVLANAIIIIINLIIVKIKKKAAERRIAELGIGDKEGENRFSGYIKNFSLPAFFITDSGKILWTNTAFDEVCKECSKSRRQIVREIYGLRIKGRMALILASEKPYNPEVRIGDRYYVMHCNAVESQNSYSADNDAIAALMVYFYDITELQLLQEKYDRERVAVGEIVIDAYDEIFQSNGETVMNRVLVETDRLFENWLSGKGAVLRRLVRDRYLLIIADEHLRELEKGSFSILDSVKKISKGNTVPVTLSIGIAAHGESLAKNFKDAQDAVNLALGRGGDQAIVRIGGKDTYYGSSNIELERKNKVKVRITADMLKNEILKSSRVFVMGHSSGDMDSLGASLAVYRIASRMNVKANIILNSSNVQIDTLYSELIKNEEYREAFIHESEALNLVDEDTLMVVVDTFKQALTEAPSVIDETERIAVIDHHRKGSDFIENTVLSYTETYASSTSEIMVEILSHLAPNMSVPKLEAEALYAGILVDTKNFAFKTGK